MDALLDIPSLTLRVTINLCCTNLQRMVRLSNELAHAWGDDQPVLPNVNRVDDNVNRWIRRRDLIILVDGMARRLCIARARFKQGVLVH